MQRKVIIVRTGKFALPRILIVFVDSRSVRCEAVEGTYIQSKVTIFVDMYMSYGRGTTGENVTSERKKT